jgi:MoxR-like ATPase
VHANIVLLDEINRSSAKTQSAMLEAMEERQTTIAGTVYPMIATQNPVDQEGTYPLSEAQTGRFMLKEIVPYPLRRRRWRSSPEWTTRTIEVNR